MAINCKGCDHLGEASAESHCSQFSIVQYSAMAQMDSCNSHTGLKVKPKEQQPAGPSGYYLHLQPENTGSTTPTEPRV